MTAKEYLISQLSDEYPEPHSVQTRTALCAYAMRINQEVDGYSIENAERTIKDCGLSGEFTKKCIDFIRDAKEAYQYCSRIPELED